MKYKAKTENPKWNCTDFLIIFIGENRFLIIEPYFMIFSNETEAYIDT